MPPIKWRRPGAVINSDRWTEKNAELAIRCPRPIANRSEGALAMAAFSHHGEIFESDFPLRAYSNSDSDRFGGRRARF
jgi:hypothetical protein